MQLVVSYETELPAI